MTNDTIETSETKPSRVTYGFELKFPQTFTLRDLRKQKSHKVKYITLYSRVRKALAAGEIVISGEKTPKAKRRGRREVVYSLANVSTASLTTAEAVATV